MVSTGTLAGLINYLQCDFSSLFFLCSDPPPVVRQLTKRVKTPSHKSGLEKSKGCAFLEFSKASGLQNALRLHHSVLDGRKINVELSAGGGGKSAERIKKLQVKNAKLDVRIQPFERASSDNPVHI